MKLIRSSSFPSSSRAQLAIIPRHAQKRSLHASARPVPPQMPQIIRRSSRMCHSSSWTRASRSMADLEHSSSCKWLRTGPLASRDRQCEACMTYTREGIQMSPRELEWEWKMHVFQRQLKKDPYSILFGRSEQRLRGLNDDFVRHIFKRGTRFAREVTRPRLNSRDMPDSSSILSEAETVTLMELSAKGMSLEQIQAAALPHKPLSTLRNTCQEQGILFNNTSDIATVNVANEQPPRSAAASYIDAKGNWSIHVNENGRVSKASGKLVFDPITMRMIPEEVDRDSHREVAAEQRPFPRKVAVQADPMPVRVTNMETIAVANQKQPKTAAPKASQQPWSTGDETKRGSTDRADAATVKQVFEQSYTEARKAQRTISQEHRTSSVAKAGKITHDLAAAWQKEQAAATAAAGSAPPQQTSANITKLDQAFTKTKSTLEDAWQNDNSHTAASTESPASGQPHYVGRQLQPRSHEAQMTYLSLLRKDKPLRSMNSHELNQHKMKLLASWTKDARTAGSSSRKRALQQLAEEVTRQRKAYAAFEGKWHLRDPSQVVRGTSAELAAEAKTEVKAKVTKERIAENLRDIEKDLEKMEANALVREVREIYENSYGVIDTQHQQGEVKSQTAPDTQKNRRPPPRQPGTALKAALAEYEFHLGPRGYKFVMGQDKLEKEVKDKSVVDGLMSPYTDISVTVAPAAVQETNAESSLSSAGTTPATASIYRILAYDPESQTIQTAEAVPTNAAAATDEKPLSFTEALARLHNPAKFVQILGAQKIEDYDIVAARNDLLILKQVRKAQAQSSECVRPKSATRSGNASINPVDGTTRPLSPHDDPNYPPSPATCNYMSPTGFVNLEQRKLLESNPPPPPKASGPFAPAVDSTSTALAQDETSPSTSTKPDTSDTSSRRIVRKQEPVFSGGSLASPSTTSTMDDESKVVKKRRRGSGTATSASTSSSTNSNASPSAEAETEPPQPNTSQATRFGPSSFLHSTRTYYPTSTSSSFSPNNTRDNPPTSRATDNGKHGKSFRSKLTLAAYIAACCYATGVVIEFFRSGPSSDPPSPTSPPQSTKGFNLNVSTGSTNRASGESALKEQRGYVRHAWGDDLLARPSRAAAVAPAVVATPKVQQQEAVPASLPVLAGFEAEDAAIERENVTVDDLRAKQRQEKMGALEGMFAFGAGAAAAVCVLLGGFGGSG